MALLFAVLDVNDETPTFFPAVYNVSVSEDVPREFRVVWLNCTDNDVGLNAELSYFITGNFPCCLLAPPLPPDRDLDQVGTERGKGTWASTPVPPPPPARACSWFPGSFKAEGVLGGVGRRDSADWGVPSLHLRVRTQSLQECGSILPRKLLPVERQMVANSLNG